MYLVPNSLDNIHKCNTIQNKVLWKSTFRCIFPEAFFVEELFLNHDFALCYMAKN